MTFVRGDIVTYDPARGDRDLGPGWRPEEGTWVVTNLLPIVREDGRRGYHLGLQRPDGSDRCYAPAWECKPVTNGAE